MHACACARVRVRVTMRKSRNNSRAGAALQPPPQPPLMLRQAAKERAQVQQKLYTKRKVNLLQPLVLQEHPKHCLGV